MNNILTVTLNPTIDKNFMVDHLVPDSKLRCPDPRIDAGGGGINVSKGIKRLGGNSVALTLTGGRNGGLLAELMQREEIPLVQIAIEGETRESITISETSSNRQYRIVLDGPPVSNTVAAQLLNTIQQMDPFPDVVVASGSLPAGVGDDYYAKIGKIVTVRGARYIVDSSGKALLNAVEQGVYLVKPNIKELSALAGVEMLELENVDEAAIELIKKGKCEVVMVSLGSSGAVLVTAKGYRHIPAPAVERKSTVGAGDSMVAGMVWSMQEGRTLEEMAMMGVACGTAATMNEGTQLFKKADVDRLYKWISKK